MMTYNVPISLRQSVAAYVCRVLFLALLCSNSAIAGCRQASSGSASTKPDDDPKIRALIKKAKEYEDEKEFPEAEKTYQEAIAAGSGKAAVMQAGMYWDWEPDKNAEKMFALYKIAADRGDSDGEVFLGMAYERGGYRNKPEPAKAIPLYEQAAKQNNPGGFYHLGTAYIFGVGGLERNFVKARDLLTRATNLGDDIAPIMLAKLYSYGRGALKKIMQKL
jgi:TPR repeat protein